MIDQQKIYEPDLSAPLVIGATGMAAILQNIKIIILTLRYSIPLDRAFAHDAKPLDSPGPAITASLTGQLIDAIEKYEPRVKVDSLEFVGSSAEGMDGIFRPKIVFHLAKGAKV